MASLKLSFSLRTTSNVKQVHLVGSWDSYKGQLPLTRESSSKSCKWKGTFKFSSSLMKPGHRYWFYYMLDGYAVSHDPSQEFTVEPTTGRKLNILDVPKTAGSSKPSASASSRSARRTSRDIPRGQPAAEIRSPKPIRPENLAKKLERCVIDDISAKLAAAQLEEAAQYQRLQAAAANAYHQQHLTSAFTDDSDIDSDIDSDVGSDCPSLSGASNTSTSSLSSPSLSSSSSSSSSSLRSFSPESDSDTCSTTSSIRSTCSCERYGITRRGDRVKLDCGGKRCGYELEDSCDDDDEEDSAEYKLRIKHAHRRARV